MGNEEKIMEKDRKQEPLSKSKEWIPPFLGRINDYSKDWAKQKREKTKEKKKANRSFIIIWIEENRFKSILVCTK
jgi:transposase